MASEGYPTVWERVVALFDPAPLLWRSSFEYFRICLEAVFLRGELFSPIFRTAKLRDEAFGRFWLKFSAVDPTAPPKPPQGSAALIPPLLARASGTVLDIGPGSGTQIPLLKDVTTIQTIYGAEPCIGLHNELRSRILAANLQDKYRVLHCGAQKETLIPALENAGVDVSCPAIFDTILCVRVLCSIPDPDRTIADLYDLLKPGGQLLVTEHVVNPGWRSKGSILARLAQAVYELLGWGFFMGDCHMNRDTARSLRNAAEKDGGWELVELEEHFWWSPIMYISGRLVKKA
ncbi:hypothetical protein DTO195F2_258 [Paecilomyces variotii]|nr:hypothetical protein DTO195F2_258 [Paecilomyces variotii]KAJ9308702.1 hypothetical protein DTO217A2_1944 [Paecilomyces variotii]KAJ9373206.1 hypothetical protein DTO282E5_2273 [Paecilomyces variotii]KAJ9394456.1 hypothetical protein DTO282F9_8632 [Paecilomyces variotii]